MSSPAETVAGLDDAEAVRVLALVLDHAGHLPDPATLRQADARLASAAAEGADGSGAPISQGELAREALAYLVGSDPATAGVVRRALAVPADVTRLDPGTLAVGGLVLLALQTEVDLYRDEDGRWRLRIRKPSLKDSTLVKLVDKLISLYR
jgi:hypothetical protein